MRISNFQRKESDFSDYYLKQKEKINDRFKKRILKDKEWKTIVNYSLSNRAFQKKYLEIFSKNPDYHFKIVSYLNKREKDLIFWIKNRMPPHEIIWKDNEEIDKAIREKFDQIRKIELPEWKPREQREKNKQNLESKLDNTSIQLEFDF